MNFLLVIGEGGSDKNQMVAVAIRIDDDTNTRKQISVHSTTRSTMVQIGQPPPRSVADAINNALEKEMVANNSSTNTGGGDEKEFVSIRRFQILPISLAGVDDIPNLVVGSTPTSVPPSLALLFVDNYAAQMNIMLRSLFCISQVPCFDEATGKSAHPLFAKYRVGKDVDRTDRTEHGLFLTRIETNWDPRHTARVLLSDEVTSNSTLWCYQGQGWCLVGGVGKANFISSHSSTSLQGSFAMEVGDLEEDAGQDLTSLIVPTVDSVGPVNAAQNLPIADMFGEECISGMYPASKQDQSQEILEEENPFLMEAIASISTSSFCKGSLLSIHLPETPQNVYAFSHKEKSHRLVCWCSSWMVLEQSTDVRQQLSLQTPVVSVKIG